jgi:hypothetical protein
MEEQFGILCDSLSHSLQSNFFEVFSAANCLAKPTVKLHMTVTVASLALVTLRDLTL